jgi:transcriptional regulator GlxA family with amidase domain
MDWRVRRILQSLSENPARQVTLRSFSASLRTSAATLGTLFRREMGLRFHEYLLGVRLKSAREILTDPTVPIKEVGKRCGFTSHGTFYRVFRKYYGQTPQQIRSASLLEKHNSEIKSSVLTIER